MSTPNDQMIQALLSQRFSQPGGQMPPIGGMGNPVVGQQVNPNAASQIAQKLMLMRALQQRPPGVPQAAPQVPASGGAAALPTGMLQP